MWKYLWYKNHVRPKAQAKSTAIESARSAGVPFPEQTSWEVKNLTSAPWPTKQAVLKIQTPATFCCGILSIPVPTARMVPVHPQYPSIAEPQILLLQQRIPEPMDSRFPDCNERLPGSAQN